MRFQSNPARDASSAIAGYVYQIDVTILRWLNLQPNELLELERGEDLDVVRVSDDHDQDLRTLEQVKARAGVLTLRSTNALAALANFCEHRHTNPTHFLKFRYITTSRIGRERGWSLKNLKSTVIELWESVRAGELDGDDQAAAVSAIRSFLRSCRKPGGVKPSTWGFLENVLADENEPDFRDVIQSLEWSTSSGDAASLQADIKRGLIESDYAKDQETAEALFQRLFLYVIKRLTEQGLKTLTVGELREQLKQPSLSSDDLNFLVAIRDRVANLEREVAEGKSLLKSVDEQVQVLAGAYKAVIEYEQAHVSLDIPALVTPGIQRTHIVDEVADEINTRTWVGIVGEPGSGKTQLCLLITRKLGSTGVWVSLRGLTQERSCAVIDAALEAISGVGRHPIIKQWYSQAAARLDPGTTIVLDDLPGVVVGSALDRRLQFLHSACREHGLRMLSTTYYEAPRALFEAGVVSEVRAPRFTAGEILELLRINGAPSGVADSKFADFLEVLTGG